MITQKQVRKLFDYNPETGILTNKIYRGGGTVVGGISGSINGAGYLCTKIKCISYRIHRICFLHYHGYLPSRIDHKDTNKLNNKILNLRKCTLQQNAHNSKTRKDNTSGVKGVTWCKGLGKWAARIRVDGEEKWLGRFNDIEDAKKEVELARVELHGEFARHE